MSTTLRFAKHLRRLTGVGWRVVLNQPRIEVTGVKLGFHQTRSLDLNLTKSYATNAATLSRGVQYGENDSHLQFLCDRVGRIGKVSIKTVRKALLEVQKSGKLSSLDALSLIKSCGRPLIEAPNNECLQLVHEIWDTCAGLKVHMDTSHYNTLLNVYLEKGHTFSPNSFLTTMLDSSIAPNRITYQRLIAAYCDKGDIAGATKILETMNDQGLPLCENIFNSLIVGHSEAGDLQSAIGILETMKKAEIEPSSDTYVTILCAYAKHAHIDLIDTTLDKLESSERYLGQSQLLEIVYALAVNGHIDEAEKFVDGRLREVRSDADVNRILAKLVNINQISLMMKVYEATSIDPMRHLVRSRTILRVITSNNQILADDIIHVCKWFEAKKFDSGAFQAAAYNCFLSERDAIVIYPLFKAWREQGHEIQPHYFWPILRLCLKHNDVNGMMNVMKTMIEDFKVIPCVETLKDFVLPYIFDSWQDAIQALRTLGVPKENIYLAMLHRLLAEYRMKNAAKFMVVYPIKYPREMYLTDLVNTYMVRKNARSFLDALRLLDRDPAAINDSTTSIELIDDAVRQLIRVLPPYQFRILTNFLNELKQFRLSISPEVGEEIKLFLNDNIDSQISETIEKLTMQTDTEVPVGESNPYKYEGEGKTDSVTLQDLRVDFAQALDRKDINVVRQIIEAMEVANLSSHPILAEALEQFCETEDITFAERCINAMKKDPNMKLDVIKSLKYAKLLVAKNRIDDAIAFISELPFILENVNESRTFRRQIRALIETLSQVGSVENSFQMLELLKSKNLKLNGNAVGPMVKVHLDRDDLVTALEVYRRISTEYKFAPYKMDFIKTIILKKDAQSLQTITDINKSIHGEGSSIIDLIFAFIECDHPHQARKICDSWAGQISRNRLTHHITRLGQRENLKALQQLPKVLRGPIHVDLSHMCNSILDVYIERNDWQKGLELWTEMQETDIRPSEIFLENLSKLLRHNNQEVPFFQLLTKNNGDSSYSTAERKFHQALNERDYDWAQYILASVSDSEQAHKLCETMISRILRNENIDKVVDVTKKVSDKYWPLSTGCLSALLWKLVNANRMRDFEALGDRMTDEMKINCNYHKLRAIASINTDGFKAFIENMKISDSDSAAVMNDIPVYTVVRTLISDPSLVELTKNKAEELHQKGIHSLMHALWNYYFIIESPEADNLWNNCISMIGNPNVRPIIRYAGTIQDQRLIERVREFLRQNSTVANEWDLSLKTALFKIHTSHGRYQDALQLLQKEPQLGSKIGRRDMKTLKKGLINSGAILPSVIQDNSTGPEESTEMQEESERDTVQEV